MILASDGMWFVLSRIAVNEIYGTACIVAGAYTFSRFYKERRPRDLLVTGVIFGVGITMKWSVFPLFIVCLVLSLGTMVAQKRKSGFVPRVTLVAWISGFLLLPVLIYLASYVPYFVVGHSWRDFLDLNRAIASFHSHFMTDANHPLASRWYEWPFDIKPMPMLSEFYEQRRHVVYGMGNPVVWWLFLPALLWTTVRWFAHRRPADAVLIIAILTAWLPWAFVQRATFLRYLMPAIPFVAIATATMLADLESWSRRARFLLPGYATVCAAMFLYFYPIWSAAPIAPGSMERWLWFASWR
jgi:dolichyl-phosphate-mannose--protein O-mannosyl transferase